MVRLRGAVSFYFALNSFLTSYRINRVTIGHVTIVVQTTVRRSPAEAGIPILLLYSHTPNALIETALAKRPQGGHRGMARVPLGSALRRKRLVAVAERLHALRVSAYASATRVRVRVRVRVRIRVQRVCARTFAHLRSHVMQMWFVSIGLLALECTEPHAVC